MDTHERRIVLDALRSDRPLPERIIGFQVGIYYFGGRHELADAIESDNSEVIAELSNALREARLDLTEKLRYCHLPSQTTRDSVAAAVEQSYQESGVPGFIASLRSQLGRANLCLHNGTPHIDAFGHHILGREKSGYYEPTIRGTYLHAICKAIGVKDTSPLERDRY